MNKPSVNYTSTAIGLHWLIFLLIFAAFSLGLYMHDLPLTPDKLRLYNYHKWLGVSILLLVVLRLGWRATHRPPALPDAMVCWEKSAAHVMHYLLYALMFAIPLSGWLMSSAKGFQTVWFGVLPLPDLIGKDKELGKQLAEVHELLSYALLGLVVVHAAAALKHHFLVRDDILTRMLPWLRKKD